MENRNSASEEYSEVIYDGLAEEESEVKQNSENLPLSENTFGDGSFTDLTAEGGEENDEPRYDEIFDTERKKTRAFAVTSMILGILSVICCCIGWGGLVLGTLAIVFAVISRKSLNYFDPMSIAGLVLGIFGVCFGVLVIILMMGPMAEMLEEIFSSVE